LINKAAKTVVEFGDYQTPLSFARLVCRKLREIYGLSPKVVIEPTFGKGNFLNGILDIFPDIRSLYGIEINKHYFDITQKKIQSKIETKLFNADIFAFDFGAIKKNIAKNDSVLIIGNPPWVTNSQLSSMDSDNLPAKSNFKGYAGLDAMTGKGNFDIAENIILRLLSEFSGYDCTLAMLCKTSVAKNIVRDMKKYIFSMSAMDMYLFDAEETFGVNCDAGLLVIKLGGKNTSFCKVYDFDTNKEKKQFGWFGNAFYSDFSHIDCAVDINGVSQFEWRQGIKHDCSKVMELSAVGTNRYQNGFGENCSFELGTFVYPLVKSSDIKSIEITDTRKFVIVPQKKINDNTLQIKELDSNVWEYLSKHEALLNSRRSSIYKRSPKFAVFGVGDYSFAKYKVGISGFYKIPVFSLIWNECPIMLDDTCYFLSFDTLSHALITVALLNSKENIGFLKSIAFLDSKRPYTKEVLRRIDFAKLTELVDFTFVNEFVRSMPNNHFVSENDYHEYRRMLNPECLFQ
jgi:16S rRNA A1518/A1519 N6-dimethyltransferase RsmA/KsgA/DIM1 with predicted DNA glycosylase/AP lyase activity